jgi:hypothetical protein
MFGSREMRDKGVQPDFAWMCASSERVIFGVRVSPLHRHIIAPITLSLGRCI